ncbi:hypothetical protein [Dictyobacter kobayashii]|uniref:MalT-like winged helix domain-containing protein n=1 Tax=Dictyobacter kobayashii TaxID=2014872 RepID=A0A402AEU6_9CHLR|nr:hypothetical protein [Dictyobacter kobayashii]GCE17638.1 hypothetical protein KDK_14380 [Dictyobacter kobayashii]
MLQLNTLLITKLLIPSTRPHVVFRSKLINQLQEVLQRKITFISTPAGFGKTTLLSEWAQQKHCPVAWVSLDKGDNDLIRFWSYLINALETLYPGIGEHTLALLHTPQSSSFEAVITMLINALMTIEEHFVLVLDDYHVIETTPIHDSVSLLLEHMPPYMHIVIASRTMSPLPLPRLRARGQLLALDATDLYFTTEETLEFFNQTMQLDITLDVATKIQARTEGWIAGLQLAALSLQRGTDISHFLTVFNGGHRYILDYLTAEVFSQQSEEVQHFLLHTAILNQLSEPLCNVLTGRENGQIMLELLEQGNLFIIPFDEKRHWYRYSQLFGDFLYNRLQYLYPQLVLVLHRRASAWYEQNNFMAEAVDHSLAATDFERAVRLIRRVGKIFEQNGEITTLLRWLNTLPEHLVCKEPQLCLLRGWGLATTGQLSEAQLWLRYAKKG